METNLQKLNKPFNTRYKKLYDLQEKLLNELKTYSFDLSCREITDAIIARMDAFWLFAVKNKELLKRNTNAPADDFFTETVLLFFKAYFEQRYGDQILVYSEKNIAPKGNIPPIIKPDISILSKSGDPLAVVELKVNDAWKRNDIYTHLQNRKSDIKNINKNCFFGVISYWKFKHPYEGSENLNIIALREFLNAKTHEHRTLGQKVETILGEIDKVIEKSLA